jgi:hypothetical protein
MEVGFCVVLKIHSLNNFIMGTAELIILIIVFVLSIFLIRLFGAWMLRIDEVIALLKSIDKSLKQSEVETKAKKYDESNK